MGRLERWLFGEVTAGDGATTGRPAVPVAAAAGAVALARTGPTAPPWGFAEHFLPVEWAGAAAAGWWSRESAMSLPVVSRARDLICSAVGALPITLWSIDHGAAPPVERQMPPPGWTDRPDPDRTRQWQLAWTADDLFFYGVSHWLIVERYAAPNDWPKAFRRVTPGDLTVDDDGTVKYLGAPLNPRDVVEFCSPIQGLLSNGYRAISIALALDDAADRFAGTEVPAGLLEEQEGGEDLSTAELSTMAEEFTRARRSNTTAATNKYVRYRETSYDASKMQLVEGRQYQALELARLGNVPPYLVGAPAGTGMTYLNGEQARADLLDFGAMPYIGCIEQTLSGPNVTPRGQAVRLDTVAWLRNPFTTIEPGTDPPPPGEPTPVPS